MSESFDAPTLARLVLAHVGASPDSLRFTPIRTGKHNTSYWVDSDQGRFVLRVAPPDGAGCLFYERRMMRQEPRLHYLIRATTAVPVAAVIGHDSSRTLIDQLLDLYIELFNHPVTPCLLHMDVWSQSILIDNTGNVAGLVDFDRALRSRYIIARTFEFIQANVQVKPERRVPRIFRYGAR